MVSFRSFAIHLSLASSLLHISQGGFLCMFIGVIVSLHWDAYHIHSELWKHCGTWSWQQKLRLCKEQEARERENTCQRPSQGLKTSRHQKKRKWDAERQLFMQNVLASQPPFGHCPRMKCQAPLKIVPPQSGRRPSIGCPRYSLGRCQGYIRNVRPREPDAREIRVQQRLV